MIKKYLERRFMAWAAEASEKLDQVIEQEKAHNAEIRATELKALRERADFSRELDSKIAHLLGILKAMETEPALEKLDAVTKSAAEMFFKHGAGR